MNGFEKTQVTRDFQKAIDNFKTTCLTQNETYKDVQGATLIITSGKYIYIIYITIVIT